MNKQGAFLTLGMTFISILILSLGTAMLRNAESTEERIFELGSLDRLYTLEQSAQQAYREQFLRLFPFNMSQDNGWHAVEMSLPSFFGTIDPAFSSFAALHNITQSLMKLLAPSFSFINHSLYPGQNATAFIVPEINVSYVYVGVRDLTTFSLPSSAFANSHGLLVYTGSVDPTALSYVVKSYNITVRNPLINGTVKWETWTPGAPGGIRLTVEYFGNGDNHTVDSRLISFDSGGDVAQKIFLNLSHGDEYYAKLVPLITVRKATAGPFSGMGEIFIESLAYNFSTTVTMGYTTPLQGNLSVFSYDRFNLTLPQLGIGKSARYRLV